MRDRRGIPYVTVEAPDRTASVDFLDLNTNVRLTVENGKLRVQVTEQLAEDSSQFSYEEFSYEFKFGDK